MQNYIRNFIITIITIGLDINFLLKSKKNSKSN